MKSMEELNALREKAREGMWVRDDQYKGTRVLVDMGESGLAAGARDILEALGAAAAAAGLEVQVLVTGSVGGSGSQPAVQVLEHGKPPVTYGNMTRERAADIVKRHLAGGQPVAEYTVAANKGEEEA